MVAIFKSHNINVLQENIPNNKTMATKYDYLFKLLMIGDSGVGKTSIMLRFSDDEFNSTFISTLGVDFKFHFVDLDGKKIKLQICDTAGQERFRSLTTAYYRGAKGVILVYDITDERSFNNVQNWLINIEEHIGSDVEKIILGNKCDINDKRKVATDRGLALASQYNVKFMETSAKTSRNVEEAFISLARDVKQKMDRKPKNPSSDANEGKIKLTTESKPKKTWWKCTLF